MFKYLAGVVLALSLFVTPAMAQEDKVCETIQDSMEYVRKEVDQMGGVGVPISNVALDKYTGLYVMVQLGAPEEHLDRTDSVQLIRIAYLSHSYVVGFDSEGCAIGHAFVPNAVLHPLLTGEGTPDNDLENSV